MLALSAKRRCRTIVHVDGGGGRDTDINLRDGGVEITLKDSKGGLGLHKRNKRRLAA